jgi:hypothetical protein
MNGNVVYVGLDVDDVQYYGSALDRRTGEVLSLHCRPTLKGLVGQLENLRKHFGEAELKLCYEASYVGFSLQRECCSPGTTRGRVAAIAFRLRDESAKYGRSACRRVGSPCHWPPCEFSDLSKAPTDRLGRDAHWRPDDRQAERSQHSSFGLLQHAGNQ